MENRKYVKILAPMMVWGFFVLPQTALAYGVETHAYLTSEIFDFYNTHFQDKKIPENLKPFLIDGARREDDAPRWLNHFYDPVNEKGLTSVYGDGYASKVWAEDKEKQTEVRYKAYAFIISILTAWQEKQIGALTTESDFTWERAVEYYVRGDKEKAMFVLGHIIHLLEDSSVPDHTRNDPHPGHEWDKSPYENYTKNFSLENLDSGMKVRLKASVPVNKNATKDYFNSLAQYSNNNFYSRHTIGFSGGYEKPQPRDFETIYEKEGDAVIFGLGNDGIGNNFRLYVQPADTSVLVSLVDVATVDDPRIMSDYWSLLSTKAVQHGAGLIDLFFKEVAKAEEEGRYGEPQKSFFANMWDGVSSWWDWVNGGGSGSSSADSARSPLTSSGANVIEIVGEENFNLGTAKESQAETQYEEIRSPETADQSLGDRISGGVAGTSTATLFPIHNDNTSYNYSGGGGSGIVGNSASTESTPEPGSQTNQPQVIQEAAPINEDREPTSAPEVLPASHLVVSEIQAGTNENGAEDEFVELYNPTEAAVDLSGWSLKKKTASGNESNLVSARGFAGVIAPKSFFLIAHENYIGSIAPDLTYSANSNNLAYASNSALLYDAEGNLVDEVFYDSIAKDKSLERRAVVRGNCVAAQGENTSTTLSINEFLGNGCDSDAATNFNEREIPKPQNTNSLPEPREAPAVSDFNISFSTSSLEINFGWSGNGNASDTMFDVKENDEEQIYIGTSTETSMRVFEVGRDYKFSIEAEDKDGLRSEKVLKEIAVPGILSGIHFYEAPSSSIFGSLPILELRYDSYPFLPDLTSVTKEPNFKVLTFFKNREAPKDEFLNGSKPLDENIPISLSVEYETCVGAKGYYSSLLLPDDESQCGSAGGFMNMALKFQKYLINNFNRLFFKVRSYDGDSAFNPDDFLTVAYYGFYRTYPQGTESGAFNNFKLLAVDKTKYYFNGKLPNHAAPKLMGEILFEYDKGGSLTARWTDAGDADTKREFISYEVNFATSSEFVPDNWTSVSKATSSGRAVYPGDQFLVGVRAKDDFGNYSDTLVKEWSHPEIQFIIDETNKNAWSASWGSINVNCSVCGEDIDSASFQSFSLAKDSSFNKVILDINRDSGSDGFSHRLRVFGNSGSDTPDFENKIAEARSGNNIFYFENPVNIAANNTYWFVLDARYGNPRGYYRNSFRNAISTESSFEGGVAGSGASDTCSGSSYCPTTRIPFPTANSDWYMRVGFEE